MIKRLLCCLVAVFILVMPALAVVEDGENLAQSQMVDQIADTVSPLVNSSAPAYSSVSADSEVSSGGNTFYVLNPPVDSNLPPEDLVPDPELLESVSVYSVSPIEPSDVTGLKAVLLSLFGSYDPVVVEFAYSSSNGYTNYLREIQPDYVWIASAAIFALVVYCVFRLGGALFHG